MKTLEEKAEDAALVSVCMLALALGGLMCWLWLHPWAVVVLGIALFVCFFARALHLWKRADRAGH